MNQRTSLIIITSLTATFVAICAAVFSVAGIAKLFAGAALSAGIMASALELGKIVSISFLYQYWKDIPKTLKIYLSSAATILMLVTSAGIYGYLSSAYAKVAATPLQLNAEIQTADGRAQSIEQDIQRKNERLSQLISLRVQQEQRLDNLVSKSTTGNNSTIRSSQGSLNAADKNVNTLQNEISKLSQQRDSLRGIVIGKQVEIETNGDIGTFVYIAKVFGVPLDIVVKWFTLIIVLVFDPLAVALVIAVNFLLKNKKSETIENKNIILKEDAFTKIEELIENPPPSTEELKQLLNNKEPYAVYVSKDKPDSGEDALNRYLDLNNNGIPDWMERDFNWDDTSLWINNPIATIYKKQILDGRG